MPGHGCSCLRGAEYAGPLAWYAAGCAQGFLSRPLQLSFLFFSLAAVSVFTHDSILSAAAGLPRVPGMPHTDAPP